MIGTLTVALALTMGAPETFSADKVRLLSQIPLAGFLGSPASGAGCSGYVSPSGREYAIMCLRNGYSVVDISLPKAPRVVGHITGPQSLWHEVAVLGSYAYGVTEAGGGMQIIDLTQADTGVVSLASTYTWAGNSRAHTVQASAKTKTVYLNGSANMANGGIIALDASDPTAPSLVGTWSQAYVHDCTIHNPTTGPWAGKEIIFACCGYDGLFIIDATDRANMVTLGNVRYLTVGTYCHSGSLTPDGKTFLINDEFDEGAGVSNGATTHLIDVQDYRNPKVRGTFTTGVPVIDHNSMVQDGHLMLAAYKGGLRVYGVENTARIAEKGFFDTFPGEDGYDYLGAWGTFAGFPSGNVIISDINRGLFVVDPSEAKGWGAAITQVTATGSTAQTATTLRRPDGSRFALTNPRIGTSDMAVRFETASAGTRSVVLSARVQASQPGDLLIAFVRNVKLGRLQHAAQWTLRGEEQTVTTISTLDPKLFVGPGGQIDTQWVVVKRSRSAGVAATFDMIRAEVR